MEDGRPSPDALLERITAAEARQSQGKLKIFFGFAPGVGKTYAMLGEARRRKTEGADVVIGVVETHGRAETGRLLEGLETLARAERVYQGATLQEFDLDAALARRPGLLLVDELAHTNAPGSRHAKRWQDVDELLAAGIDVYATVNVQHLESLNDVVGKITGVTVRETIPDAILERADELELVDISPEDLLGRLREGKVYVPDQAARAIESFFRRGNLIALRELSLRRTAERVAAQMVDYKREKSIGAPWAAADRLLVCVGPSPFAARLVRATKGMAETLHAEWAALSIETPASANLSDADRDRIAETLRLAEQLGAETATVSAAKLSDAILSYAREHNVTKIVVGKPLRRRLRDRVFGSVVDELVWSCGEIDVYVITGEGETAGAARRPEQSSRPIGPDFLDSFATTVLATLIAAAMFSHFAPAGLAMVYFLAVVLSSVRRGRRASILTTCMSVAAFDFFFVPPHFTFAVAEFEYALTFAVMLGVGLLTSELTARVRFQAERANNRERLTSSLFALSRLLSAARDRAAVQTLAGRHISEALREEAEVLLPDARGKVEAASPAALAAAEELAVAQWVYDRALPAGRGTDTLSGSKCRYIPILLHGACLGVLRLRPPEDSRAPDPERMRFIEALCDQVALALERISLSDSAQAARLDAEAERLRNAMLSSLSHDLRTPLTVIAGSASSLMESAPDLDARTRAEFARTIYEEAGRLDRLVHNLLEMTRLEAGGLKPNRDWHVLEEVVGSALARLEGFLRDRKISIELPQDLPLVKLDELLIEQVLINLLENAVKYTPAESPIEVSARKIEKEVVVEIADRGPGLPPGEEARIFEKFYQASRTPGRRGVGLGLAICRSLVEAHGGKISARNREGGGAIFSFTLPLEDAAPASESLPAHEAAL